jgi:hypothetical protein
MVYKIEISVYTTQIQHLNNDWITQHRANNPTDTVTQRYVDEWVWRGFGYVVKDAITEQYITDYVEIVEELPTMWHEDKAIKIKQTKNGVLWGIMNIPQIASGLAMHRQAMNMQTYEEGEKLYFYANTILPEHQAIFDAYPQLEITVNHAEN